MAQRIYSCERIQKSVERTHVGERSEISGTVLHDVASFEKFWERFVCNAQNWIRFAVFEVYVVTGRVFFDERVL